MISGKSFAFTGEMSTMSRKHAQEEVLSKGGSIPSSVTRDLDYLVVGNLDSPLIKVHGKRGKKFLKAEELNEREQTIQIITEGQFIDMLQSEVLKKVDA
ncbi:hypothetical protein CSB45_03125 [candidate division KSB3 bacterium]|uniref:BRCT domain-containing protein n=1 Tax=candidate division KSB3 bacterium TaxID=2044937 RepID=A0A2G6E8Y5_9BACT|nr:MAG: hypothetical protein CSB45_03125 [candidate division KSB3 bacterium]PIE28974.1 MAG: hypothetical protein CSA57_10965 [candidate division KSB3 bacterium]